MVLLGVESHEVLSLASEHFPVSIPRCMLGGAHSIKRLHLTAYSLRSYSLRLPAAGEA